MGIDLYLHWRGQTASERSVQITGYKMDAGQVGYLREAYHGGPYATRILAPEAFEYDGITCPEGHEGDCAEHCDDLHYGHDQDYGIHLDGSKCGCKQLGAPIPANVIAGRIEEASGAVIRRFQEVYKEDIGPESPYVKAYLDFAKLACDKEAEGKEIFVYASW